MAIEQRLESVMGEPCRLALYRYDGIVTMLNNLRDQCYDLIELVFNPDTSKTDVDHVEVTLIANRYNDFRPGNMVNIRIYVRRQGRSYAAHSNTTLIVNADGTLSEKTIGVSEFNEVDEGQAQV